MKPIPALNEKTLHRFWVKVNKIAGHGPTGTCWVWTAGLAGGYGCVGLRYQGKIKTYRAHRVSYFIEHGKQPGAHCCHTCDNPTCVNPAHLYSGTAKTNCQDRDTRNRGLHTFTKKQIEQIRARLQKGELQSVVAKDFKVSRALICLIAKNKRYKNQEGVIPPSTERFKGTNNPRSKLNPEKVKEIRQRRQQGESSIKLGKEFGVSKQVILSVERRKTWSHVE